MSDAEATPLDAAILPGPKAARKPFYTSLSWQVLLESASPSYLGL